MHSLIDSARLLAGPRHDRRYAEATLVGQHYAKTLTWATAADVAALLQAGQLARLPSGELQLLAKGRDYLVHIRPMRNRDDLRADPMAGMRQLWREACAA